MKFRKRLFVIFIFSVVYSIYGQNNSIDSLKNLLINSSGISKVDLLLQLSSKYKNHDNKEHLKYSQEALSIANQLNYISGKAKALIEYGYALNELNEHSASMKALSEAQKIFANLDDEKGLMIAYHYMGKNYDYRGKTDSAFFYYRKALGFANSLQNLKDIAQIEMNIGILYWSQGQFQTSLRNFQRALKIREKLKDLEAIGNSKNSIGSVYFRLGNFPMAMKYFNSSMQIRQKLKDTLGMIISNNNIGSVYQKLELFEIAEKYFNTANQLSAKVEYRFGKALTLHNLGILNLEKKDYSKSLEYLEKAYDIAQKILSQNLRTMILNYEGLNYERMKNFEKAEMFYNWGLSIAKQTKDQYLESLLYQALARINLEKNKIDLAEKLLANGHKFALENSIDELLKDNYYLFYKIYSKKNNKLKALEHYKLFSEMKDSLLFQKENNLATILLKYELEQSDKEKKLLQREKSVIEKEKNYQVFLKNLFIIVSILVIFSIVLLYIMYANRVKSQKLIERQKAELESLNKQLSELNKQKDKLFTVIAHDLKSPFQSLLGHSDLLRSEINQLNSEQIKQIAENVNESGRKIYNLIIALLDWAKQQLGRYHFQPENFNISAVIDEVYFINQNLLKSKKINYVKNYSEELFVFADKQRITSVIRNLFSNAIKFTEIEGKIEISCFERNDTIEFCISDNGVGIDEELAAKIFSSDFVESKAGTKNELGTGLGLNLSKEFIEKNKGKIWLESKLGEGSKFYFKLPNRAISD